MNALTIALVVVETLDQNPVNIFTADVVFAPAFNTPPPDLEPEIDFMSPDGIDMIIRTIVHNLCNIECSVSAAYWLAILETMINSGNEEQAFLRNTKLSLLLIMSRLSTNTVLRYLDSVDSMTCDEAHPVLSENVTKLLNSDNFLEALHEGVPMNYHLRLPIPVLSVSGIDEELCGFVCFHQMVAVNSMHVSPSDAAGEVNLANIIAHEAAHTQLRNVTQNMNIYTPDFIHESLHEDAETGAESGFIFERRLWQNRTPSWEKPSARRGAVQLAQYILNSITPDHNRFDLLAQPWLLPALDDYVGSTLSENTGGAYTSHSKSFK